MASGGEPPTKTVRRDSLPSAGAARVVIESVTPQVDGGRFPVKRVVGDEVVVEAVIFADGHDQLNATLRYSAPGSGVWVETPLERLKNDRWSGAFPVEQVGQYAYTVEAWIDHYGSWSKGLEKKLQAGQSVPLELREGADLISASGERAAGEERRQLDEAAAVLVDESLPERLRAERALQARLRALVAKHAPRLHPTRFERELQVVVDPVVARFSSWYEMFPRSCASEPGKHGTLRDCAARLDRIQDMGFDVLYLPPIHPIGRTHRKGKNNALESTPEDPGSPWAIGGEAGGHKAIHPELGTPEDFRYLISEAKRREISVALDVAFQCSPDHPYVKDHPQWFRQRPDGSIQYAENPPKKYQDIYPLNFETDDWQSLWLELRSVFEFWAREGVRIFRVDNPHTKSFRFWEWCITSLKTEWPEMIFLAEAFTRPSVMYYLAKLGFTQSYNYFPWRNTAYELTQYLTEVTRSEIREYFRPNLWPNTPDILPQFLQFGGPPAFMIRLILAATLGASYGVYGPAFEMCENTPREPGSEEYLNSEKYEIRHWDLSSAQNISGLMRRLNQIRKSNPAFYTNDKLEFHPCDNEQLLAFSKQSKDGQNLVLMVVNLDPRHTQRGWVSLPLASWGIGARDTFQAHDLLTDAHYLWTGERNYVELNPTFVPAHIFRVRRFVRTEHDFDYFL